MKYIWDTNILVYALRKSEFLDDLKLRYRLDDTLSNVYISAVTVGEIHSIALRNRWGKERMASLSKLLASLTTIFVNDEPFLYKCIQKLIITAKAIILRLN